MGIRDVSTAIDGCSDVKMNYRLGGKFEDWTFVINGRTVNLTVNGGTSLSEVIKQAKNA
jgi:hypothetical protein